jgi:hypothetical protein
LTSRDSSVNAVSEFVLAALQQGMVYCCVWGPGCEGFHDIIDDIVVEDGLSERRVVGATPNDVIMTTWHANESLEEALEFFKLQHCPQRDLLPTATFEWPSAMQFRVRQQLRTHFGKKKD